MIYLGYAPGGSARATSKSGVSIIRASADTIRSETGSVGCVDEAMDWYFDRLRNDTPSAVGVDVLMFWETSRCGWRGADRWLRSTYSPIMRSVLPSNSVQGAAAIQGMALAVSLRRNWPEIILTETHPRVLYYAMTGNRYEWSPKVAQWLRDSVGSELGAAIQTQNEWSALTSAWTAMMGHSGTWSHDLRQYTKAAVEPAGPVMFWWPGTGRPDQLASEKSGDPGAPAAPLRRFSHKRKSAQTRPQVRLARPIAAGLS